jgi:glutamate dehydrogenase (NADP+)
MSYIQDVLDSIAKKREGEHEFLQAAREVLESLAPVIDRTPHYRKQRILERIVEPEWQITFRVPWQDDQGEVHIGRGFRLGFNSALGPCCSGLRFHPSVSRGILKLLGFEQVFRNSLARLPVGGGAGGSDFDPRGKSDDEVMRFCQSFMNGLFRHLGPEMDPPTGDIGIGPREIGYLVGQYKRLCGECAGRLTDMTWNSRGLPACSQVTGYGSVYFAQEMLKTRGETFAGKLCTVSGCGRVAQSTVEKLLQLGAKVVTLSDSDGSIYDANGITTEKLAWVMSHKTVRRARINEYADVFRAEYREGRRPWDIPCDCAFPSATQNEITGDDARTLLQNGCYLVAECANVPTTPEAARVFVERRILYAPSKAANAGSAAISALSISQESIQDGCWSREDADSKLQAAVLSVHNACREAAEEHGQPGNYVLGANIAGFLRVAAAILAQGLV